MSESQTLVVKLGTSVLTGGSRRLNRAHIVELVRQCAQLHAMGHRIVIVTSGAIAAGREHLADTLNRNVGGTVFTVQAVLPLLNEGASVVLAGSTSASEGVPAFGAYAASKAAVRSLGRTWAAELAERGIREIARLNDVANAVNARLWHRIGARLDAEREAAS